MYLHRLQQLNSCCVSLQLIIVGDIVRGHVILKTAVALGVLVTSVVGSCKVREMSDLDVRGLVPLESLASDKDRCEGVLEDMQMQDVVQGKSVEEEEETKRCLWTSL